MQDECGVIVGWCICQCRICMEGDTWVPSTALFSLSEASSTLNPTIKSIGIKPEICVLRYDFFLRKKIYGKYGICQKFKNSLYYSITFLLQLWCNGRWIIVYHLSMNLLFFLTSYTLSHHNCDKKSYIIVFNIRVSFGTCV